MTLPSWFDKVRPWLVPLAVLLLVGALAYALNRGHRAEVDLAKERERREKLEGKLVEEEVSKKELQGRLDEAVKRVPELQAQVDDLTKRVGSVKVKEVVRVVTIPGPAGGEVRPDPVTPPPGTHDGLPPAGNLCLVAQGDLLRVEVDEATLETKAGNKVLVGAASCWRQTPTETKLYQGNFQVPLSSAVVAEEAHPPRWGPGVLFVATTDKVGVGPVVLFPPFRVFGGSVDASAGFAAGSRGFVAATIQAGMRLP